MNSPIRVGLLGDTGLFERVQADLRAANVETRSEALSPDAAQTDAELIVIDVAGLDKRPQEVTQRIRHWGSPPFVVFAERMSLDEARTWQTLGAAEYLAVEETQRWQMICEYVRRGSRTVLSSHLLQTVIDAVPIPIFFKDDRGEYLGCNRAFEECLGYPRDSILGKTMFDIAPGHLTPLYDVADQRLLLTGESEVYETRILFADQREHHVISHKAVFKRADGSVGGIVGAVVDITERKALEQKLKTLATLDPLTGVNNRRSFAQLSNAELARCRREDRPICVLVLDVDHFKGINDSFGHAAGDEVLVALAERSMKLLRAHDIFGRAGGEEFFAALGNTGLEEAEMIAERLRANLAAMRIPHDGVDMQITVSIGVAEWRVSEGLDVALHRADSAMYQAKHMGRNRVYAQAAAKATG